MNQNNLGMVLKFAGGALLLGVWGLFAYTGKTPVEGFMNAVELGVGALLGWHAGTSATNGGAK